MKSSDKQATAELLAALVEVAIARGCRHYSESGEPLATTLAVLECLQREGLRHTVVEDPARRCSAPAPAAGTPLKLLARLALERVSVSRPSIGLSKAASAGSPLAPGPLAFPGDPRPRLGGIATPRGAAPVR